ncbi:hypothetical protein Tco_0718021 [Tanacetum coccineum]
MIAEGDLRKFSDIRAWYAIEDYVQYDKKCSNPTNVISDETIAYPNAQIVRDDMVRVHVPRCMAWLDYDELVDSLKAEAARKVHATHARIVTEFVPESAKKKSGGRSSKSVVIQDTPSAPKSKLATSKSKLKGAPSLTQEEKEVVDIMQDLKESKKSSKRQPGPGGSNKGTGSKPGVPDKSTVISATSNEQDSEYSDDENDDNDDVEKDDKDGDADDEGDDHISDTQDADDEMIISKNSLIEMENEVLTVWTFALFHRLDHREGCRARRGGIPHMVTPRGVLCLKGLMNVTDSDDPSYGEDERTLALPLKVQKVSAQASKVAGEASTPLDVDSDPDIHEFPSAKELRDVTYCHWVVAHVTPPSWKQCLREISIEQLCDIHDRAYMRQDVLDNIDKDRAYAELERKCNKALQDLDKNPLISDMRAEIKVLQGQVDGLHSEYSRIILEERKWEVDSLKQDRAAVVSKVIPDAAIKLVRSDDLGVLITKLVKSSIIYGRCQAFKEVAAMEEPFVLEKMSGYRPSSK